MLAQPQNPSRPAVRPSPDSPSTRQSYLARVGRVRRKAAAKGGSRYGGGTPHCAGHWPCLQNRAAATIHSDRTHTPIVSETLLAFASHSVSRVMEERRGSRGRNYTRPNPDLSSVSPAVQPPVTKCLAKEPRLRMLINPTLPVVIASALANLT